MPATLAVGHLNVHNRPAAVRAAMRMGCDVVGFNEAGRRRGQLARRRGYRLHMAQPVVQERGRDVAGDCATLVRKRYEYLGEWQQQVSQQVDAASRVAPDRWFVASAFRVDKQRVVHINVHPNAGPEALRHKPASPITREYAEAMGWLDRMLGVYRRQGYALLLGGDLNLPEVDVPWSPWPVLDKHGLSWHRQHIDAVAWSGHFRKRRAEVLPREQVHSDHPALRVVLEVVA